MTAKSVMVMELSIHLVPDKFRRSFGRRFSIARIASEGAVQEYRVSIIYPPPPPPEVGDSAAILIPPTTNTQAGTRELAQMVSAPRVEFC
jgi:hypothetical protein